MQLVAGLSKEDTKNFIHMTDMSLGKGKARLICTPSPLHVFTEPLWLDSWYWWLIRAVTVYTQWLGASKEQVAAASSLELELTWHQFISAIQFGQRQPRSKVTEEFPLVNGGGGGLVTKSCLTLVTPMSYSLPGTCVHGISQAKMLESVSIPFSRGPSQPRYWAQISCICRKLGHQDQTSQS